MTITKEQADVALKGLAALAKDHPNADALEYVRHETVVSYIEQLEAENKRTAPTAPSEDAVEALADAMRFYSHDTAERCLRQLAAQCYTLRRETMSDKKLQEALAYFRPHPVDYNKITLTASKCRKHISTIEAALSELQARRDADSRRKTMTEAELAREALQIAENYTVAKPSMLEHREAICALAKKYRG